ncbi:MAG: glycosyltransferase family 2 protein [Terriglobales bacterium]
MSCLEKPSANPAPAISIGLPFHNAAPHLEDALRSIFAQSFTDWELLLVDDGSTDSSLALARSLADARVRIFSDGERRGLAARLNQIVAAARGRFLARMDADDLIHPRRLEKQIALLSRVPELDAAGCGLLVFDSRRGATGWRPMPEEHAAICSHPLYGFRLVHATVVARTEWLRKFPYNPENKYCEDLELWLSCYRGSRFANLPEPLYYYREFESFALGKYARAKASLVSFLWRRRREFGPGPAAAACLRHAACIPVYALAEITGLRRSLIQRRSRPLDPALRAEFDQAWHTIRATALPTASVEGKGSLQAGAAQRQ